MGSGVGTVFAAMVVDLVTPEMRASGFGTMQAVSSLGPLTAFGIGYWLLSRNITDYSWFWAVAVGLQCMLLVFQIFFMPVRSIHHGALAPTPFQQFQQQPAEPSESGVQETLPASKRSSFSCARDNPISCESTTAFLSPP